MPFIIETCYVCGGDYGQDEVGPFSTRLDVDEALKSLVRVNSHVVGARIVEIPEVPPPIAPE